IALHNLSTSSGGSSSRSQLRMAPRSERVRALLGDSRQELASRNSDLNLRPPLGAARGAFPIRPQIFIGRSHGAPLGEAWSRPASGFFGECCWNRRAKLPLIAPSGQHIESFVRGTWDCHQSQVESRLITYVDTVYGGTLAHQLPGTLKKVGRQCT